MHHSELSNDFAKTFLLEVVNLSQNQNADRISYAIRPSGRTFVRVPYNRMSQEIQRITRMGGKIINVKPISVNWPTREPDKPESSEILENIIFLPELADARSEFRDTSGFAWWLEVVTQQPQCTYYFGPFDSSEEALSSQAGYLEDLKEEGATGISVQVKWCKPDVLTIF